MDQPPSPLCGRERSRARAARDKKWGSGKALLAAAISVFVVGAPAVHAEANAPERWDRLVLNGARPMAEPLNSIAGGLTPAEYAALAPQIGAGWLPGTNPVRVDYPATVGPLWGRNAPTGDESIANGRDNLHEALLTTTVDGDGVHVAGLSMGAIVMDDELAHLTTDPNAPPADQLTFTIFASPTRGLTETLLSPGSFIPIFGYTSRSIPESQYDVDVVFAQYDLFAHTPDRPWNLISLANSILGAVYIHTPTATADRSEAVLVSSTTNSKSGTTRTFMIPTPRLPLTQPLRDAGLPTSMVDKIDDVVRPIVDAGYSSNDTGRLRAPYLRHGRLVFPKRAPSSEAPATEASSPRLVNADPPTSAPREPAGTGHASQTPRSADSRSDPLRTDLRSRTRSEPVAPLSKTDTPRDATYPRQRLRRSEQHLPRPSTSPTSSGLCQTCRRVLGPPRTTEPDPATTDIDARVTAHEHPNQPATTNGEQDGPDRRSRLGARQPASLP